MDKSALQTLAIIATVVATAWVLGGDINSLRGGIKANSAAIADLREDVRELRGLLISHISGHNHTTVVANAESKK